MKENTQKDKDKIALDIILWTIAFLVGLSLLIYTAIDGEIDVFFPGIALTIMAVINLLIALKNLSNSKKK